MEELNQNNYMPKKYFNRNNNNYNNNFLNSSLNQSMRNNNYINSGNNKYKEVLENQIINNNTSNISQDTISLVQIKNDLDSMNNKLNMISETLFNMNFFNSSTKKKINLKKNNSMNNKYINTNKKIPPNIYNTRYNFLVQKFSTIFISFPLLLKSPLKTPYFYTQKNTNTPYKLLNFLLKFSDSLSRSNPYV